MGKPVSPTGRIVRPFIDHGCRVVWIQWNDGDGESLADPILHDHVPALVGHETASPFLLGQGSRLPLVDSLERPARIRSLLRVGALSPRAAGSNHTGCSISPIYRIELRNGIHHRQRREWVQTTSWAGWSHRSLQVFEIGDRIFMPKPAGPLPGPYPSWDLVPYRFHGDDVIVDALGAERAARAFARYIS